MVKIADQLGKNCNRSIRMASGGRAEMEAAYRFMDNPKVTPEKIPSPHRQSTLDRVGQRNVALLVHDTTELDLTRLSHQAHGGGPLSHDSRFGSYLHPLVAFTAEGLA